MASKYATVKSVLHILDLVLPNQDIKHKGKAIRNAIKRLPEIDAVEVCRCENCKYYFPFNSTEGRCELHNLLRWCEDFCSDGERKEGA